MFINLLQHLQKSSAAANTVKTENKPGMPRAYYEENIYMLALQKSQGRYFLAFFKSIYWIQTVLLLKVK